MCDYLKLIGFILAVLLLTTTLAAGPEGCSYCISGDYIRDLKGTIEAQKQAWNEAAPEQK